MNTLQKTYRFVWRSSRNILCSIPAGRKILYPNNKLAKRFGPEDVEYAWSVFLSHLSKLRCSGFEGAGRILEAGPGRNLGAALLWWAEMTARGLPNVRVVCWDVFPNAAPVGPEYWRDLAKDIIARWPLSHKSISILHNQTKDVLTEVASTGRPAIEYTVSSLQDLIHQSGTNSFDLVYSQAVLEHIWFIGEFWELISRLTVSEGWHSHRIDLADHGRRQINPVEMLQWSDWSYWMTQRFIPGSINRWRASDHISRIKQIGFKIKREEVEVFHSLTIPRKWLAPQFRAREDVDILSIGLDVVAIKL